MTSIGAAVATRQEEDKTSPRALVAMYRPEFTDILPSHIRAESWIRQVAGSLRRGAIDKATGQFKLEIAARNNPQAFVNALRVAAGLGLMPGTDEFFLTPRPNKGRLEILGIVGYQGYIELMYRAGAVASVIVELVKDHDGFTYMPGRDERPLHEIDWRSPDRGATFLVYAYAIMKDGATSKVIVLNEHDINRIKKKSASANYDDSPWNTDPDAMWMKSAVRQLRKFVPTSAEFITTQLRAAKEAEQPAMSAHLPNPTPDIPDTTDDQHDDVIEAEFVEDPGV